MLKIKYRGEWAVIPSSRIYYALADAQADGYRLCGHIYNGLAFNSHDEDTLVTGDFVEKDGTLAFVRKTGVFTGRAFINDYCVAICMGATREECLLELTRGEYCDKVIIQRDEVKI